MDNSSFLHFSSTLTFFHFSSIHFCLPCFLSIPFFRQHIVSSTHFFRLDVFSFAHFSRVESRFKKREVLKLIYLSQVVNWQGPV